jgi:hypothetical protein
LGSGGVFGRPDGIDRMTVRSRPKRRRARAAYCRLVDSIERNRQFCAGPCQGEHPEDSLGSIAATKAVLNRPTFPRFYRKVTAQSSSPTMRLLVFSKTYRTNYAPAPHRAMCTAPAWFRPRWEDQVGPFVSKPKLGTCRPSTWPRLRSQALACRSPSRPWWHPRSPAKQ